MSWCSTFGLSLSILWMHGTAHSQDHGRAAEKERLPKDRQALRVLAQAKSNEAAKQLESGDHKGAEASLKDALRVLETLYPKSTYEHGHAEIATTTCELGICLQLARNYGGALTCFEKALRMQRALYPADDFPNGHPDLVTSLNLIGMALELLGRAQGAVPHLDEAIGMCKKLYPSGHAHFAWTLRNYCEVGASLQSAGNHSVALACFEKALRMQRALYPVAQFPDGHADLITSLNLLAIALKSVGRTREAISPLDEALGICEKLFPAGHEDFAWTLRNYCDVGASLQSAGDYPIALACFEKALRMQRALYPAAQFPDGHADLITSLNLLGIALKSVGSPREAIPPLAEALEMCDKLFPSGNEDFAWTLQNIGDAIRALGEISMSLECVESALAIERRLYPASKFPKGHPIVARTLSSLGMLYNEIGDYGRARQMIEDAIDILRGLDEESHSAYLTDQVSTCLNNLALVCEATGEHAKARDYLREALAIAQRTYPAPEYPDGHPDVAIALQNLGYVMQSCGDRRGARDQLEKALQMCERLYPLTAFPNGHGQLAAILDSLGFAEMEEGRYDTALEYVERALEMRRRLAADRGPQGEADVALSTNNVASLMAATGNSHAARELYTDALARLERVYKAEYPDGHPIVASVAIYLAGCEVVDGSPEVGFARLRGAMAMRQRLADEYYASAAEAEALNFAETMWADQSNLISAGKACSADADAIYSVLWPARRAIQRMMQSRTAALNNPLHDMTNPRRKRIRGKSLRRGRQPRSPARAYAGRICPARATR